MMNPSLAPDLDNLLAENPSRAMERQAGELDRLTAGSSARLVLFGAGNMGRTIARKLRFTDIRPIAFADNNPLLWGQCIEGIPILSPESAAVRFGSSATFVISIWGVGARDRMAARKRQLHQLGCENVITFVPLFWKFSELFLPYHVIDQPHKVLQDSAAIRAVSQLWSDEFSRIEYASQIAWRLRGDFDRMADPVTQTIYFPAELFTMGSHEVFVDCGAFDGDTIRSFLDVTGSRFDRIIAFEPDPANYEKLCRTIAALPPECAGRIETHARANGSSHCRVRFRALGTDGSAVGPGELEVECVALDEALAGAVPSLIKMDIEGAEIEALEGARRVIARHSPVLAVCSYHRQSDLWRIPAFIHSIQPDYRLFLRPHLNEGWDVVCYAVAPRRKAT